MTGLDWYLRLRQYWQIDGPLLPGHQCIIDQSRWRSQTLLAVESLNSPHLIMIQQSQETSLYLT